MYVQGVCVPSFTVLVVTIFSVYCRTRKAKDRHGVEVNVHCNGQNLKPTTLGTVWRTVSIANFSTGEIGILDTI
jgi:hypothetical protein